MAWTLLAPLQRYARWLHTGWPAGTVERFPEVQPDGTTAIRGLYVVGDLTGIPLLKFAADTGARAIGTIASDPSFERRERRPGVVDLAIIGGGVSGMSAALEARRRGIEFTVIEAYEEFATIVNFPKRKPIYTYPTDMTPAGELKLTANVKESLVTELREQQKAAGIVPRKARIEQVRRGRGALEVVVADGEPILAHRVIIAIGRSGNFRRLNVPGETLDKVMTILHDPKDYAGQDVLVVGGGDTALGAAIALTTAGARVTLSYRGDKLSRPKPEVIEQLEALEKQTSGPGSLRPALGTQVKEIRPTEAVLTKRGSADRTIPNDTVFVMIGREAPLDFFRRTGIAIRGEWGAATWSVLAVGLAVCIFLYNWKAGGALNAAFKAHHWFPYAVPDSLASLGTAWSRPSNLLGTLAISLGSPGFYYSLAYTLCIVVFGFRRIARRKTPYVTAQTATLMAVQLVPLFLLPYVILPWIGHNGAFDTGAGKWLGDQLFPSTQWDPQGREYWRAFGFILAWPLFIWNFFSYKPMALWLAISFFQTFVVVPLIVWRWGKGAYCGWICSCGALAETMGDTHRQKMPHGLLWNRLNLVGQAVLAAAIVLGILRVIAWAAPGSVWAKIFDAALSNWHPFGIPINYYWIVDVTLAGILGVGLYFVLSGRVWCRFACPLAALMHVYARFSQFRILSDKKKCISCNVCTSVCHQGIDVMSFANKGLPMEDPECVRCSACVSNCPTGVLTFGRVDRRGALISIDSLLASRVQGAESRP